MKIPDCYEADRQFDAMDRLYTAKMMRRPLCERCGQHIVSDTYLDLSELGSSGYVCERCVDACTYSTCDLEDW